MTDQPEPHEIPEEEKPLTKIDPATGAVVPVLEEEEEEAADPVEFDHEKAKLLLELLTLTKEIASLDPLRMAAGLQLEQMAKEVKKELDEKMKEARTKADERIAAANKKRDEMIKKTEAQKELARREELEKLRELAGAQPEPQPTVEEQPPPRTDTQPIERRM
jgi:ParB-like chromosome segregation protein Spo0J